MKLRVECYAGYRAEERPQRFFLRQRRFEVREVLDQWYGPHDFFVRVRADDGNIYILRHSTDPNLDLWTLESFRRAAGE
ncbi:MAG: hypothetical protein L0212_02415 [Acidobacteria bacterium]|nr:hypothetical protein [Acidobacteriota bacterium]